MNKLPDGSAFFVVSLPLPKDHWIYAEGADEPIDLPPPILTHALREQVTAAARYAIRGATMCGKETDFDPDALVQNVVYALCGPFTQTAVAEDPRDAKIASLQAKIDALMLEYCPEEMTLEQMEEWAAHQVVCEDPRDKVIEECRHILSGIKLYRAFNGDDWPAREAEQALAAIEQLGKEKS